MRAHRDHGKPFKDIPVTGMVTREEVAAIDEAAERARNCCNMPELEARR